jgi:deferrochelatase/peroxidase EfeB
LPLIDTTTDFGFLDGISNPFVTGFPGEANPGQARVPAGEIFLGAANDSVRTRPPWTKDGSFLVFRQLKQLVPEFNKFLADHPVGQNLSPEAGSQLLGARMVGRWKSVSRVNCEGLP